MTIFLEIFLFVFYLFLVLFGIKEFVIWSQISNVLVQNDIQSNILILSSIIAENNPHMSRLLLMFPFYLISDIFSFDLKTFYSIVLIILLFITYWINRKILEVVINKNKSIFILVFYILLSFFMHGRIIFSITGNTILLFLLYEFYKNKKLKLYKNIFLFIVSIWMVSVSSGTLMVYLLTIFIFYLLQLISRLPYIKKKILLLFGFFIIFLLSILPLVLVVIEKNLNYFGDSILKMTSHGAGQYLLHLYIILPIFFVFISALPLFYYSIRRYTILILPLSMILSSMIVGLFGFSSLVSGIPAYILFFYIYKYKKTYKRLYSV